MPHNSVNHKHNQTKSNPSLSFLYDKNFAHRGLHGTFFQNNTKTFIPENSLAAFENAIDHHFAIELDIHILSDKKIIVFHDNNTKRLTKSSIKLKKSTLEDIQNLSLQSEQTTDEHCIPTFKKVLDLIAGKTPLIVELKSEPFVNYRKFCKKTTSLLLEYQKTYSATNFAIKSFDPRIVHWFKKYTTFPTGLLIASRPRILIYFGSIFLRFPLIHWLKPDFLSVDKRIIQRTTIQRIRKSHPVLCWTIQSDSEHKYYRDKADNLIFENIHKKQN